MEEINQLIQEKAAFKQLLKLLSILHQLAKHEKITLLASEGYLPPKVMEGSDKTHEYIF